MYIFDVIYKLPAIFPKIIMKKITIFITISIITVVILTYLIELDRFDDSKFSLVLDVINATQVIITFIIAYLLYDRLGTSRKLLDKQNEIVIEYIEQLKSIRLNIYHWTGENVYTNRSIGISRNLNWVSFEKDNPILFKSNFHSYPKVQKLYELVNHPLFPIEIKNDVDIFSRSVMTSTLSDYKLGYVFVSFEDESEFKMKEWMYSGDTLETCVKINGFINKIENLLLILENWVNKESSIKIKLNFN
jgi:hypothetical protein